MWKTKTKKQQKKSKIKLVRKLYSAATESLIPITFTFRKEKKQKAEKKTAIHTNRWVNQAEFYTDNNGPTHRLCLEIFIATSVVVYENPKNPNLFFIQKTNVLSLFCTTDSPFDRGLLIFSTKLFAGRLSMFLRSGSFIKIFTNRRMLATQIYTSERTTKDTALAKSNR